jgi:hypothetical protein
VRPYCLRPLHTHPGSRAAGARRRAPVADGLCRREQRAAAGLVGKVEGRTLDTDPANIECLIAGQGVRADVVTQASAQAWTAYNTMVVHQAQAYGSGGVHVTSQLPRPVPGMGGNAAWIPALHELVATNGTPSTAGTYVTVKVAHTSARGPASLGLARAIAVTTFRYAPRGPNAGPPSR